jgi:hypothetical protein
VLKENPALQGSGGALVAVSREARPGDMQI